MFVIGCVDSVNQRKIQKICTPNEMQSTRSFEQEFIPEDLHQKLKCTKLKSDCAHKQKGKRFSPGLTIFSATVSNIS